MLHAFFFFLNKCTAHQDNIVLEVYTPSNPLFNCKTGVCRGIPFVLIFDPKRRSGVHVSTHNLCFGPKIRKIGIPLYTRVSLYKSGDERGILYMDMLP